MLKRMFICLFFFYSLLGNAVTDKEYIAGVSATLAANSNDLETIAKAGNYFYKRKNYKMAIWYFSSPILYKHPKFPAIKLRYANSLYLLGQYQSAYYNYKYLSTLKISKEIREKIEKMIDKCLESYTPPEDKVYSSISLYGGSMSVTPTTLKEKASFYGLYFNRSKVKSNFELGIEFLDLKFNETLQVSDYTQTDYTVAYSLFNDSFKSKYRVAYHGNGVSSDSALKSNSFLLDYSYYYRAYYFLGLDFSYTGFSGATATSFRNIMIAPKVSFPLGEKFSGILRYNIAKNNLAAPATTSRSSFEAQINFLYKRFFAATSFMTGEEQYFLTDGGFVIQNSTDITTRSLVLEAGTTIGNRLTVSAKYTRNNYQDDNNTGDFLSQITMFKVGLSF